MCINIIGKLAGIVTGIAQGVLRSVRFATKVLHVVAVACMIIITLGEKAL